MNEALVNNINNVVGQDDILIHCGDFSFGGFDNILRFRERIICTQIHLILGNHDHWIERNHLGVRSLFYSVNDYGELTYNKKTFILFHYPITSWNGIGRGNIHLFGHQHSLPDKKFRNGKSMNVGMDSHEEFRPYNINEILAIMEKRPILFSDDDHHLDNIKNKV